MLLFRHYILYKTTNKINGKIYIGIHGTENLNDGYIGSGKLISKAIKKYGRNNFERQILAHCSSYEELMKLEREIVTEDFIANNQTYNMELGGAGGKIWTNELKQKVSLSKIGSIAWNKGLAIGDNLTSAGREKLKNKMTGSNNPMYGINVANIISEEKNKERLRKISENNKKPKLQTKAYSEYAKSRFFIVNRDGKIEHCNDLNDERLLSGLYKRGKKWRDF